MTRQAKALVALICLQLSVAAVSGRTLLNVGTSKTVNADFKNVFAKGIDNEVDQAVNVFAPDDDPAPGPQAVEELTAADFEPLILDPWNPTCTLSDKEDYVHFSISKYQPIVTDGKTEKFEFYVNPDLEIRPMAVIRLDDRSSTGGSYLMGDGMGRDPSEELKVNREIPIKTLCGTWTWSAGGQYEMMMRTKRSSVVLLYHARLRGQAQGAFTEDTALNIGLDVETTVAGNNKNLDTQTDVKSKTEGNKLVITLSNTVKDMKLEEEEEEDPFADLFGSLGLGRR
mmetsp:Transcript_8098/g.23230  ORF Transcript_8098/g.23230 Transcript_8098/m.23230 type:complete len:284 (-) Transcript_8098:213-1064(-)